MFGENWFNLDEALKECVLISGCNHSGKTRLACGLASTLHKLGYQVIAFDTTKAWLSVSDLPFYVRPFYARTHYGRQLIIPETPETSFILDLSRQTLSKTRKIVDSICLEIWNSRIDQNNRPLFLIFEESETFLKNIRGSVAENIYRLAHVGRNIKVRCIFITTDLALLDASIIRLCSQRFHGKLNIEENSKRKFRAYYGKDYTRIACEGLTTGDFIRLQNQKLDLISVPLFQPNNRPLPYVRIEAKPKPRKKLFGIF